MNALKTLQMACIDGIAVTTFLVAQVIAWPQALVTMAGIVFGSYTGALFAHRLEPELVRRFVIVAGFCAAGYCFVRG
ncbi:MAG: sulfite exporter TauE/SafE family protein [Aphanocapsa lilacina HA4352-LM1]|nr:sulfite exporter TauE/SafE family protein [Aphanocapsa lilacina HA4352-LM1]